PGEARGAKARPSLVTAPLAAEEYCYVTTVGRRSGRPQSARSRHVSCVVWPLTMTKDKSRNSKPPELPDQAWAKNTVSGPSSPPTTGPPNSRSSRSRGGSHGHDEASAGDHLARKIVATEEMAARVPHNPLKADEHGEEAALRPPAGKPAQPGDPAVTA